VPVCDRVRRPDYGKTDKLPGLWVCADNDLFWGADAPRGWHAAYIGGGAPVELAVIGSPVWRLDAGALWNSAGHSGDPSGL